MKSVLTIYGYDNGGNLTSKTVMTASSVVETISLTYGNTVWKDLLTSYNGQSITYDTIGNPLNYRDGMKFTWKNSRELATLSKDGVSTTYQYDGNSVRTKKTVGGVTTEYYLNGNVMVAEKKGSNLITYLFDENGDRYGFLYNSTPYYYVYNGQGDVIRLVNASGSVVAKYEYDAWGKVLAVTNNAGTVQTSSTFIGNINPIRYRGYYYDAETGFYYLQSRYYDPETCRFINADDPAMLGLSQDNVLSNNLFAYCNNNAVMNEDPTGYMTAQAAIGYFGLKYGVSLSFWGLASKITAFISAIAPYLLVAVAVLVTIYLAYKVTQKVIIRNVSNKIPKKLKKGDKVDLSKFKTRLPNGQGWKGPDGWKIVKDMAKHAGSAWKLYKDGKRIATLWGDGSIRGK